MSTLGALNAKFIELRHNGHTRLYKWKHDPTCSFVLFNLNTVEFIELCGQIQNNQTCLADFSRLLKDLEAFVDDLPE